MAHLDKPLAGREQLLGRGLLHGIELARKEMTPALFAELAATRAAVVRWTTEMFARAPALTPTVPFGPTGPADPTARDRRAAPGVVGRRVLHDPFNLSWHLPRRYESVSRVAVFRWACRSWGRAIARPRPASRADLRAAPVASSLADDLGPRSAAATRSDVGARC
jgi:hypothetical protein